MNILNESRVRNLFINKIEAKEEDIEYITKCKELIQENSRTRTSVTNIIDNQMREEGIFKIITIHINYRAIKRIS